MPIILQPSSPEQAGWEEIYGPDYPYSWQEPGQPLDVPVVQNQLCRVRYSTREGLPGFAVDAWDRAAGDTPSGGWVEQGKMLITRTGDAGLVHPHVVSASVFEWTPDRAIVSAVLVAATDGRSRERLLITLQRGWTGPRFEVYGPRKQDTTQPLLALRYSVPPGDPNCSIIKIDAAGARIAATAGSGSSLFPGGGTMVGDGTFTGENEVILLRQGASKQTNFAVVQKAVACFAASSSDGYGTAGNVVDLESAAAGYVSAHVGYCDQATDQILEAESFRYSGSSTASVAVTAGASGGESVLETQTSEVVATLQKASNLAAGKYRVLLRAQTGGTGFTLTGHWHPFSDGVAGSISASAVIPAIWDWVDAGEILAAADPVLALVTWASFAGVDVWTDRLELVRLEDRTASKAGYVGARDLGQSVLYDARADPRRVQRQGA